MGEEVGLVVVFKQEHVGKMDTTALLTSVNLSLSSLRLISLHHHFG
jgi:hypothetical protein